MSCGRNKSDFAIDGELETALIAIGRRRRASTLHRENPGLSAAFGKPNVHENTRSTNGSHHFAANATAVKWNEPMRSAPPQPNAGCKRRCRTVSPNTKTKTQKSNAKS